MKLQKNIPILSFLGRYWILLTLFAGFLLLTLNETAFQKVGAILYIPSLASGSLVVAVFLRHIFFPSTLDEDVRTGFYIEAWKQLSASERVRWVLGITTALFLGVCGIAAALAK